MDEIHKSAGKQNSKESTSTLDLAEDILMGRVVCGANVLGFLVTSVCRRVTLQFYCFQKEAR